MLELKTHQDIDQLVWSCISESTNPLDFLDYIRHVRNRFALQEQAFESAERYQGQTDAPRMFGQAVAALTELAGQGDGNAMFHLGRWYRLGYGVDVDSDRGVDWYRQGAHAGSTACMVNLGRFLAPTDPEAAIAWWQQASELGDKSAHCFWADFDKARYEWHLELGGQSTDAFAQYCWAYHLHKHAQTPEEKLRHLPLLRVAAERGESMACVFLGQMHRGGWDGCDKDEETALQWFHMGARLGNETACAAYGRHMLMDSDAELGRRYLKRGAALGDAYAQLMLGYHLVWSGKTPEQQAQGVDWMRQSALQGHTPAMSKLADVLRMGKGVAQDNAQALYWMQKGADKGNPDCQTSLGTAYMHGEIVETDHEKSHNLYHLASLQGDMWGTYLLGLTHENGDGTEQSPEKAFACFLEAAKQGMTQAIYKVGMAYLWGEGVAEDIPAGARWLRMAATEGHGLSQAYLGMMFVYGHGVEENTERAMYWLRQSAAQDNTLGLRELGFLLDAGKGVPRNREEAMHLLAKAASLGDEKAQKWIDTNCPDKPDWLKALRQTSPEDDAQK